MINIKTKIISITQDYGVNCLVVNYSSGMKRFVEVDGIYYPYYLLNKTQQKFMDNATKYTSLNNDAIWLDKNNLEEYERNIKSGYLREVI